VDGCEILHQLIRGKKQKTFWGFNMLQTHVSLSENPTSLSRSDIRSLSRSNFSST
jgi:hypothetical protein